MFGKERRKIREDGEFLFSTGGFYLGEWFLAFAMREGIRWGMILWVMIFYGYHA